MDRAIPKAEIKKEKTIKLVRVSIVLIIIIVLFYLFTSLFSPSIDRDEVLLATVTNKPIAEMLDASGLVVPIYEENITSPIQTNIQSIIMKQGTKVEPNQTILQLNTNETFNTLSQLKDEYDLKKNEKEKLNLSLERSLIDLETQFDIKILQIASMEKKLEQEEQLLKIGAGSKSSYDIAELDLSIGKKQLDQLKQQIDNQKKALIVDLNEKNLELKILQKRISEIEKSIENSAIKSEQPGVITWVNENLGAQVQKGEVVAKVADLTAFRIQARASDFNADLIVNGMPVLVDANQTQLNGTIANINPAIEGGSITFYIALEDNDHDILRSNLRVEVHMITSFKQDALVIKNGPFYYKKRNLEIYRVNGDIAERVFVDVGLSNYREVELIGEIKAGETFIISGMQDYKHLETIEMNH